MLQLICKLWRTSLLIAALVLSANAIAEEQPKIVMVLVDLSDSTVMHGDREDYKKYFNMVLDAMHDGDCLILGAIEKNPKGKPVARFSYELPIRNSFFDNSIKFDGAIRKRLGEAQQIFAGFDNEISTETPIIDTIEEVTRLFANYPRPRKILIFLSDMKEFSKGGVNFESRNFDLSESKADKLIADLREKKRIADLTGVKIYVAGARDKNAKLQGQVRDFWAKYFKAAGAEFSMDRYGTDLMAFRECQDCKARYSK